jgi:serine phosphatase RsbU (regulator of sigma subunit)
VENRPDPVLRVRDIVGDKLTVPVNCSPFTIGRRDTNCLRLGAAEVSREHAEIVCEGGRYLLRDRQSRFGTYVNGESITECELRSGDEIRLGRAGGAEIVFLRDVDEGSISGDSTPRSREGLRQITELLERFRALGTGRVLQDVLALVLDTALEVSGAERGFVMLAAPGGSLEFRLGRGPVGHTITDQTFATSRRIPQEVFDTGRTCVERDLSTTLDHPHTVELGIRHVVCVPLNLVRFVESAEPGGEERRIGVLYLDSRQKGSLLSAAMRSTLETLAGEASLAIDSARLYREQLEKVRMEQELRIAAEIQRALLPQSAPVPAYVEAAAASIPCRSIGGDFYDYPNQGRPVFSFTVGDVAGKGPAAALLSAMMQGMFAFASQAPAADSPAEILTSMNRALCQRALEARFVTLLFGVVTPDGSLTYSNAGHNPPFVVGPSGVRRLEAGGPVAGLLPEAPYDQETVALAPGDTVVVFSDGISEALNTAGEEFGEARLLDVIERASPGDPQGLVDAIVDGVRSFTAGAAQSDDITVMAVRYKGVGSVFHRN